MALEEKAKLQKHFTRFDIYFFLICTIVGVDTLGLVAAEGAQGFTWLIFLAVFFFVPYALLTAELGSAFPEEGGSYVWTRLAWGRLVAAVNAIFYWFSNPIWIGATLALLTIASSLSWAQAVRPTAAPRPDPRLSPRLDPRRPARFDRQHHAGPGQGVRTFRQASGAPTLVRKDPYDY